MERSKDSTKKGLGLSRNFLMPLKKLENKTQPLYCICRTPDPTGFMIACDHCSEWFHGECIGLSPKEAEKIKKYSCPNCQTKNPRLTTIFNPMNVKETRPHRISKKNSRPLPASVTPDVMPPPKEKSKGRKRFKGNVRKKTVAGYKRQKREKVTSPEIQDDPPPQTTLQADPIEVDPEPIEPIEFVPKSEEEPKIEIVEPSPIKSPIKKEEIVENPPQLVQVSSHEDHNYYSRSREGQPITMMAPPPLPPPNYANVNPNVPNYFWTQPPSIPENENQERSTPTNDEPIQDDLDQQMEEPVCVPTPISLPVPVPLPVSVPLPIENCNEVEERSVELNGVNYEEEKDETCFIIMDWEPPTYVYIIDDPEEDEVTQEGDDDIELDVEVSEEGLVFHIKNCQTLSPSQLALLGVSQPDEPSTLARRNGVNVSSDMKLNPFPCF